MATIPSPRTWTVGELLTAAKLNTDVRDGLNFLLAPPLAVMRKTSDQAISSSTWTAITWQAEDIDRDAGHSTVTNTGRYTSQTAGWYDLSALVWWATSESDVRRFEFNRNNVDSIPGDLRSASNNVMQSTQKRFLAVSDYIEIQVLQSSGSSKNVSASYTRIQVMWQSI